MQRAMKQKRGPRKGPATRGLQGRRRGDNQMITHPPQLPSYGLTRDIRMRFASNAAFNSQITYQNLLDTVLVAITAILGYDVFDAVRVNSIELWSIAVQGTPVTAILSFNGETVGAQGDLKLHTDTSMGIEPAHVKAKPDPLTQAGQFQVASGNVAFSLDIPSGTVIDVSMTLRQPIQGQAVACQNALVGATVGVFYYRGLDGKQTSTTSLPVVGTPFTQ